MCSEWAARRGRIEAAVFFLWPLFAAAMGDVLFTFAGSFCLLMVEIPVENLLYFPHNTSTCRCVSHSNAPFSSF